MGLQPAAHRLQEKLLNKYDVSSRTVFTIIAQNIVILVINDLF